MRNFETKLETEVDTLNADSLWIHSSSAGLDMINNAEDKEGSHKWISTTSGKEEARTTQDINKVPNF